MVVIFMLIFPFQCLYHKDLFNLKFYTVIYDYMQERNNQIGKSVCGHLICCSISSFLLSPMAYSKSSA
jgi:cellobiose-specific phosphotransferase system component IIC